jgi:hypothetical protein
MRRKADPENVARTIVAPRPRQNFISKNICLKDLAELKTREGLQKLRAILVKLKNIASPVERSFWFAELAKRTHIEENACRKKRKNECRRASSANAAKKEEELKREVSRQDRLCRAALYRSICKKQFRLLKTACLI